jgi:uncharacterized protein YjiS (DUF1127 family)
MTIGRNVIAHGALGEDTFRHARFDRLRLSVRGVLDRIVAADARHRDRVHLMRLDDDLLRDIGITRADVAAELRRSSIW